MSADLGGEMLATPPHRCDGKPCYERADPRCPDYVSPERADALAAHLLAVALTGPDDENSRSEGVRDG